jgi:hypothetical protein
MTYCDDAAVSINITLLTRDGLLANLVGECECRTLTAPILAFRPIPAGLPTLGRVNAMQSNSLAANFNGVAIDN